MISLQLLGGAVLAGESGPITGPAAQRRRVALLAMLATSPGSSVSRDKLIGCFWPEEDRERARHFLADSVFMLRKHLGKDSILTVGDDLVLNSEVVACDARVFQEAVAAGGLERAVELYRGPFMDGFFVNDAPEFERWVERERERHSQLQASALERLAIDAEAAGSPERAVERWKRLAAHDPLSSRVALRLMESFARTGDRGSAIRHARVHAALLRELIDADPDPEVESLAARIGAEPQGNSAPVAPVPASTEREETLPQALVGNGILESSGAVSPEVPRDGREGDQITPLFPIAGEVAAPRRRSWNRRTLVPLALLPLAFILLTMWAWKREPNPATAGEPVSPAPVRIAVLPFRVLGSAENHYLAEGMVTLLSAELDVAGLIEPVDSYLLLSRAEELADGQPLSMEQQQELTRSFGAQFFLVGQVVESEGKLHVSATLYEPGDPPSATVQASAEGTAAASLANTLSRQILAEQLGAPGDRLSRAAVRTTSSTAALKSYLAGDQAFRAADYARAAESFREAVREDPSFALARYRLSMAAEWSFSFGEARIEAEEALESRGMLSRRHQQLVRAWHSFITGEADEAEAIYDALVTEDPSDVEAWSGLGEVRAHYNPVRGRPTREAIPAFAKVLALAPGYGEARFHMLEFAAGDTETVRFDSLLAGVDPNSPQRLSWESARAAAWGTVADEAAAVRRLAEGEEVVIGIAVARTGVHFRDLAAAESLAGILLQPDRPTGWRAAGHIMAAQTHLARGEGDLAESQLAAAARMAPAWVLEMRALAELLPGSSPNADRLRQLRDELALWDPGRMPAELTFFFATHADVHEQLRLYLLALISVALDEDEQSAAYIRSLARAGETEEGRDFARSLSRSAAAHRARAKGDLVGALETLEQNDFTPPLERIAVSPFFAGSLDRYLRAELLRELDRPDEALSWYRSLSDGPDIMFWNAAAQRERELLNQR